MTDLKIIQGGKEEFKLYTCYTKPEEFITCSEVKEVSLKLVTDHDGRQYILKDDGADKTLIFLDEVAELLVWTEKPE